MKEAELAGPADWMERLAVIVPGIQQMKEFRSIEGSKMVIRIEPGPAGRAHDHGRLQVLHVRNRNEDPSRSDPGKFLQAANVYRVGQMLDHLETGHGIECLIPEGQSVNTGTDRRCRNSSKCRIAAVCSAGPPRGFRGQAQYTAEKETVSTPHVENAGRVRG
jgi:hypothetical protein